MRISTAQFYETSTANYQRTYAKVNQTGEEVASGIKLNTASDDPVGAARVLELSQQNSMLTQYGANISTIGTNVTKSETALKSIQNSLQRASELIIAAGNGTYTDNDRKSAADELKAVQTQILGLMNSQDANGEYLFSGSKTSIAPYSLNSDGTYSYNGDQTSINLAIGDGLSVASNTTGWDAFETAVNSTRTSSTLTSPATNDGKISLSGGSVASSAAYSAEYLAGQPYELTFLSSTQYKITSLATNTDVTIDASSGGNFSSANAGSQTINFRGVQFSLNVNLTDAERADPALADAAIAGPPERTFTLAATTDKISTTRSNGNTSGAVITGAAVGSTPLEMAAYNNTFPAGGAVLKFTSATDYALYASPITSSSTPVSSGTMTLTPPNTTISASGINFTINGTPDINDQFVVKGGTQKTQNVLNTLSSVITALSTPADGNPVAGQKLQAALDSALGNIASGTERVSTAISAGGARQASADDQGVTNDLLKGNNKLEQGKITDSDPVDAIGRLTMQQTMLTASQLVFTKLAQLNLFSQL
ncbi:flagellar hook-associated protein 3 [Pseudomonas syringae]|uniref:flagellar hook-associated protein 3 n=1 Tax=Pseudomonas sp. ICMP 561 TaxID=1718918 RepID=UPI0004066BF1|nr:flagellar hook-associated protein 3 [Pseudomonas sp. ICMP 561]MCQ3033979.1 flagellar hook-associated protein 3 [Pseudomonas syringae]MDG6400434.1 flagellar hook-associated protein 3 [Pseudomonas quasicaspiana]PHN33511.1 flagellar biosynthesis protein FlgL [Pseudomonas sp. ICMP 561]